MTIENIRNFSIIAHIDHGKSTLADRLLELTGTIEKRKMRAQVLDMMELERERGITIKMQPVRMIYRPPQGGEFVINLIDTPGHIDFSYEVSRALKAVEGVVLLVDATQGVQAQTLSVLELARRQNLVVIPVINKIDLPSARVEAVRDEVCRLLDCPASEVISVSAKTGQGVAALLETIVKRVPSPRAEFAGQPGSRALVFDFEYSPHRGVVVYVRQLDGVIKPGDNLIFSASQKKFTAGEVGVFTPEKKPTDILSAGAIGYIVTSLKESSAARVGDTITGSVRALPAVAGFELPTPVVWASLYPANQDDFGQLKQALERLRLADAALSFEEEASASLGRGFRCGFLGMLHLEIITERLKREFNLSLVVTTPTISYELVNQATGQTRMVYSPTQFPDDLKGWQVFETITGATVITPPAYVGAILQLVHEHEGQVLTTEDFGEGRNALQLTLPLRELMRGFFDELKSVSSGYASFSYRPAERRLAEVARLDVLVAEEAVPAFTRIVSRRQIEREANRVVDRLKDLLPRQLFALKIQAQGLGRIIASRTLPALRKDVTGYLYGGDITRKRKLWEKQKRGKKKLLARGQVNIPQSVFLKMMRLAE